MLGTTYHTFGWNDIPKELTISPITANRRFREWTESGEWLTFWDGLMELRHGVPIVPRPVKAGRLLSPLPSLVLELERAYLYFNDRFFGGALSRRVVIAIERPHRKIRGYYCSRRWIKGAKKLGHIAIMSSSLGKGPTAPLEVLLHEMVHLRNDELGFRDTDPRTQYHNRLFRDVAGLAGLSCASRDLQRGYGQTKLNPRGQEAIQKLRPNKELFQWKTEAGDRSSHQ